MRNASFRGFVPTRVDLSVLVRLAFPVAVVQVGMMAMGAVDTVMVGRVSATDLAAVALGNLYFFGVAVFGMGVLFGLDPVISQAVGAQDEVAVARGVQRGAMLSLALTVFASLLLLPAGPVLGFLRQPDDVVPVAHGYALASILGVLPFYLFNVFRQSLQAMGRVAPILLTVILANLGNVVFNWILIYGNLGFPALGAVGSGWATSLSRWLMLVLLLGFGWRRLRSSVRPFRGEALAVASLMRFLRLGTPIGVQQMLEFGVFGAAGLLMGWIGTVAMASHQVALNLAALTFMVPVGIAQAAAVLVGQAVGRGDAPGARRAAGAGLITGAAFMSGTAALFLTAPLFLAEIYSADPAVVALAALLIPIAGVFQVFDGIQVVGAGVLRGVGDTRIPMVMNLLGFWVVGLPVSAFLAFGLALGPRGIWIGLASGIGAVALLLLGRVRARFGQDLRRLVIEDEDAGA
ncbi:MAG TPA: MATE family efflux transporter [Longimicrobiales bacterium]|nr:MATE family efflux transporter [Longimicrobiales bacterium]